MLDVVELPVQPNGKLHVYDVAPATGMTLYVFEVPEQIVLFSFIMPG